MLRSKLSIGRRWITVSAAFFVVLAGAAAIGAGSAAPSSSEEFFIVSSLDAGKSAMVLKRPTEVTLTMRVTEETRCRDEQGKPIRFTDLRAGDTVFIASERDSSGHSAASSIRRGPMTVEELHRRYLRF
jgi:hypothetical protein